MYSNRFDNGRSRGGGRGSCRGSYRGRGRGGPTHASSTVRPTTLVDRRFAMQPVMEATNSRMEVYGSAYNTGNYAPTKTKHFHEPAHFPQDQRFFCDRCFRGYNTEFYYKMHLKNHIKCIADGCSFEGLPRVVAKHLLTFHSYNLPSGPGSKSAIDNWIQARKRNFPSHGVVESKERRDEAKLERGEVLENRNAFGKFTLTTIDKRKRKSDHDDPKDDDETGTSGASTSGPSATASKRQRTEGTSELIEKLLANEIRHERNVILQCIRYILTHQSEFGIDSSHKDRDKEETDKER